MKKRLKSQNQQERHDAINTIAGLSEIKDNHKELLPEISKFLFDEDENIRFLAAYSLVNFAEKGMDICEIEPNLTKALNDDSLRVKKRSRLGPVLYYFPR